MTKNTGNSCEGTQVFLTEILTDASGRVTVIETDLESVVTSSFFKIADELGFADQDLRGIISSAISDRNTDLARSLLQDVVSENEDNAWGDVATCYQLHFSCDCTPVDRKLQLELGAASPAKRKKALLALLPAGCPECEMVGSWSQITDEGWYCEACGHESADLGDDAPVSTDLV